MKLELSRELSRYEKWLKNRGFGSNNTIDYNYKAQVLNNNVHIALNKISYSQFCHMQDELYDCITENIYDKQSIDIWLEDLFSKYGGCALREAERLNNARSHRIQRLKKRVGNIISYRSFFLTLTFTNKVLSTTSVKTRREYITRYLKSISNNYVANMDFGAKNGREHYHAIIQADHIDSKLWIYGNLDFELIELDSESTHKLSKYISKLTNHAIKKTNRRQALIYPKKRY